MKKKSTTTYALSSREVARALSLFSAVRRIMRTRFSEGKKMDPSTWLRIETMKFIAEHDEPKMKDIADYLSITAPSATSLVGGLTKSGLVRCSPDAHDKRTSRLALTRKGEAELKKAMAHGIQRLSGLFAGLSRAELATLISMLEHIKEESVKR